MIARFKAVCPVCRRAIEVGDKLGRFNNQWAHTNCATHADRAASARLRCSR